MALPKTNLRQVYHVACTLGEVVNGCLDTRLSALCAAARTGGKSGWAFNITEAGGSATDGMLIDGAEPYWNIFSAESPGEWFIYGASSELKLRLRREAVGSNQKYRFSLGDFAGYNHDAVRPYLFPEGSEIYIQQSQYATLVGVTIFWDFGEIDWASIIGNFTHIHVMGDRALYSANPIIDEYVPISEYNKLGHYTIELYNTAFAGIGSGGYVYFWGEFSTGEGSKICTFPTTSYGVLRWGEYWAKNVLGTVEVMIQATPSFIKASNYTVSAAEITDPDTTRPVRFNITKTGADAQAVNPSRCYMRCKWRDRDTWQDCDSYQIELPPDVNLTRTQYCTLPVRPGIDEEFVIDVQLVLVYQ